MKKFFEFTIDHPNWDVNYISENLGARPNMSHSVGEPRMTPKGHRLDGVYRSTCLLYEIGKFDSFSDGLISSIAFATPHRQFLLELDATNGRAEVIVRQHISDVNGMVLASEEVAALASLSLGFGFEILISYADQSEERRSRK